MNPLFSSSAIVIINMAGKRKSLSGGDQLPSDAPSASGVTASAKKVNRRSSTPTPGKPEPPSDRVDAAEQRQRAIEWAQRLESLTIGGESVVKKSPAPKKVSKKVDAAEVSAETTAQVTTSTVEVTTVAAPAAKKAPRKSIGSSSDAAVTPATGEKRVRVRKPKAAKDANASPAAVKM